VYIASKGKCLIVDVYIMDEPFISSNSTQIAKLPLALILVNLIAKIRI